MVCVQWKKKVIWTMSLRWRHYTTLLILICSALHSEAQLNNKTLPSCDRIHAEPARLSRRARPGDIRSACEHPNDCNEGLVCCGRAGSRRPPACSDINECEEHRCEQICVNLDGSFLCDCNEDFQLADDKVSCVSLKPAIQNDEKIQTIANDMVIDEEEESPTAESAVIAPCPPDYVLNPIASTCLQLHKEFISWYEAKDKCEARGETLAILPTDGEFKWYTKLRKDNEKWRRAHHVWLGAHLDDENEWRWEGRLNETIKKFHWHKDEASGRGRCMQLWYYMMDDTPCGRMHRYFICERVRNNS